MTSAQIATAPLDLPAGSDRISVTALGAFEPTRPTDTPATLLAELNRERKAAGFDSLPRETRVASLGFDDLGFLSFQISAEVAEFDCVEPLEHAALLR